MIDVFHPDGFEQKVRRLADGYQKRFGELLEYDIEAELARFGEYRTTLKKYVVDGVAFMRSAQQSNTKIGIEGANALMLDVDYGSYPFVTSSNTTLAGIIGGLTLNPKNITETVGVVKACIRPRFTADWQQIPRVSGRGPSRPKDWHQAPGDWTRMGEATSALEVSSFYRWQDSGNVGWPQTPMWMLDILVPVFSTSFGRI
ncbi:hypothetical protein FSARC_12956 [Fusarium sarcochroum]|uniref:Uncharacterized protein n=1 Tax=Fusarium sarcochroum TaxID=1208366 RepID=A0A8H4WVF6_9HYPO|nr:hypothetical protein FSARC_12956 [Fusarium sarcochroum]